MTKKLIERLHRLGASPVFSKTCDEAADALKQMQADRDEYHCTCMELEARIEELEAEKEDFRLGFVEFGCRVAEIEAENERLRGVVDAADAVFYGSTESTGKDFPARVEELRDALAALED